MNKNTSLSIGPHFDTFIKGTISAGRYKNASEVIRAGLRLLEEEESKLLVLREAIREGTESGIAYAFEPKSHLEKIKAKRDLDGKV